AARPLPGRAAGRPRRGRRRAARPVRGRRAAARGRLGRPQPADDRRRAPRRRRRPRGGAVMAERPTPRIAPERLPALFAPRGLLVAGASTRPGKFGVVSPVYPVACGYRGKVFATSRDGAAVLGGRTVADVEEVPDGEIDLAFVCTRAAANPARRRACAKKGITAAFVAS